MRIIGKVAVTAVPLVVCILVPLFSRIYYYLGEGTLQRDIYFIIGTLAGPILGTCPPFIVISIYAYCLIRKERSNKEIAIKMASMLLPITVFSFYWYSKYVLSPLALMVLPFINMIILIPAWLVGLAVSRVLKDARN